MVELDTRDMEVPYRRRQSAGHLARRISYPIRHLTSDAITGQALGGFGGTLAGAGTGALLLGLPAIIVTRNKRFRAVSISLGALIGGSVGSTLGGVSGAATGLFFGLARLPFAIIRSIKIDNPCRLVTPVERTVKGGWLILNNPAMAKQIAEKPVKKYLKLVSHRNGNSQ